MRYVEALAEFDGSIEPALFLAGGITGCPNWQETVVWALEDLTLTILNPKRANFPIDDPCAAEAQIAWEHRHFRKADAMLFWFPCETLCPITLYELGFWTGYRDEKGLRPLFIGVHPQYGRRLDVELQTRLARPEIRVHHDLRDLADAVRDWVNVRLV